MLRDISFASPQIAFGQNRMRKRRTIMVDASSDELYGTLLELEEGGWHALSNGSAADFYERVLADDAVMFFPGMPALDREATLASIASAAPWSSFRLDDIRLIPITADAAVLAYQATASRTGEPEYRALMNSTYARRNGTWQLVLHQHSPLPVEALQRLAS
jgi:hypothetical protein